MSAFLPAFEQAIGPAILSADGAALGAAFEQTIS
jgi:hypothetical protein